MLNALKLKNLVVDTLDDMKGRDIACLDVAAVTSITDYMLVVTGTSSRHIKAMSDEVVKRVKDAGGKVYGVEGKAGAEWTLIDLGDVVLHVMLDDTRKLYDLEALWGMSVSDAE